MNNEAKELLFTAAASGKGVVKLKVEIHTDEGAPAAHYLTVDEGKLTYIRDYSRDYFGGCDVHVNRIGRQQRGYFAESSGRLRFILIDADALPEDAYLVLRCLPHEERYA